MIGIGHAAEDADTASRITIDPPFAIVQEPSFVARFVLAANEIDLVDNVDVLVDLPDGSGWTLTIFTVDEVRRRFQHGKESGEVADGSY